MTTQAPGDRHGDHGEHAAGKRQRQLQVEVDEVVRGVDALARQVVDALAQRREAELLGLALHLEEVVQRFGDAQPVDWQRIAAHRAVRHRILDRVGGAPLAVAPVGARHVDDAAQAKGTVEPVDGHVEDRLLVPVDVVDVVEAVARRGTRSRARSGRRAGRACGSRRCSRTGTCARSRARRFRSTPAPRR